MENFPGSLVFKNTPANAGDMGSIPGPGRSHMPQSNEACAPRVLKRAQPEAGAPQQEKPPQWEAKHHSEEQPLQHEGPKHRKWCVAATAPGSQRIN